MAQMNSLLVSWNFDTLTGSDGSGQFSVPDTQNTYFGTAIDFDANENNFILKEDIKTNRQVFLDTIESSETIQCLEEDDVRIDALHKPSSLRLILENSMYQIVSDEMLNLFSTIDAYTFKFAEPFNRYRDSYTELDKARSEFFSRILEKPNVEKYIEFYKWIDSSLGYLLDQLKPENSHVSTGLKNTIESHILERNKYKHQLPLTIQPNRVFDANMPAITVRSLSRSTRSSSGSFNKNTPNDIVYVENSDLETADTENVLNRNYRKNYEVFHAAGQVSLDRITKPNKSIFKTKFSSVDGLSDIDLNWSGEYSVWNGLNNRAKSVKDAYNYSQSLPLGTQGQLTEQDFRDNNFTQRNIPYRDENYSSTSSVYYQNIPSEQVRFLHETNILYDRNSTTYETAEDAVEPPIQFCVPLRLQIKLPSGLEFLETYSPYGAVIDSFSVRNRKSYNGLLDKIYINEYNNWFSTIGTFFSKSYELSKNNLLSIRYMERMDVIFPRTDLIGLARVRTKTAYEEQKGIFSSGSITWNNNSYNNPSHTIRSFWRDSIEDRKRTRGIDQKLTGDYYYTGSFNCYQYPNIKQDPDIFENNIYYDPNIYNSMWSMDHQTDFKFEESGSAVILSCSQETYGDLAPYSHFYQSRFYLAGTQIEYDLYLQPKPQFVHNVFLNRTAINTIDTDIQFIFNKSYQQNVHCGIEPFYDTYEDFRDNVRHKTQNRSIVPEFIVSNFDLLIDDSTNASQIKALTQNRSAIRIV